MKVRALFLALALTACGQPASTTTAATTTGIEIKDAWASPTPGGVEVSAGYLTIVNHATTEDHLLGATTARANTVDVHTMTMNGGMMEMRPAGNLEIPAGGTVTLSPNGMHLMFNGAKPPFTVGENIPLTLHFDHGGDVAVSLPVHVGGP